MSQPAYSFTASASLAADPLSKETHALLKQWGIDHSLKLARFDFSRQFLQSDAPRFISSFFSDPTVTSSFRLPSLSGDQVIPIVPGGEVKYSRMNITAARMDDLMPAVSAKFVGVDSFKGIAPKRLAKYDMELTTEIDEALFDNSASSFSALNETWRSELLCALFSVLRAGGSLNQPSEKVADYLSVLKELYRTILAPVRIESETAFTFSHLSCYSITSLSKSDLFPASEEGELHPGNRCFLIVDSLRRHVTVVYNCVYV